MECTHSQLCARFTDRLCCNRTNRFAYVDLAACTKIAAIAFSAYTVTAAAGKDTADLNFIIILGNFFCLIRHDFFVERNNNLARIFVNQCFRCRTAFNPVFQRFNDAIAFYDSCNVDTTDIIIAYFDFCYIAAQDAVDSIFRKGSAGRADFHAIGVDDRFFDRFAKHIFNHGLAQGRADAFFRRTKIDVFNDISMIHVIINIKLAAMERQFRYLIGNEFIHIICREDVSFRQNDFTCTGIDDISSQYTADNLIRHESHSLTGRAGQTGPFANQVDTENIAVFFTDNDILGNIDETTGQISRVGSPQCRIGQTFTGTMGRCEVIQYRQAFPEICLDGQVDDSARRVSHQATHTSNLTNLLFITTGTGVSHHEDGVERIHVIHHDFRYVIRCFFPDGAGLTIPFIFRYKAAEIHFGYILYLFIGGIEDVPFFSRNLNIRNSNGHTSLTGIMITDCLDIIQKFRRLCIADKMEAGIDELANLFFIHEYAKAVHIDVLFIFLEFRYCFFIYFTCRERTGLQEIDPEFFFKG